MQTFGRKQPRTFASETATPACTSLTQKASIRNGKPDALAYAIAVDGKYIYCATYSHTTNAQQDIRRFRLDDGEPAPFPRSPRAEGVSWFIIGRRRKPPSKDGLGRQRAASDR